MRRDNTYFLIGLNGQVGEQHGGILFGAEPRLGLDIVRKDFIYDTGMKALVPGRSRLILSEQVEFVFERAQYGQSYAEVDGLGA